MIAMNRWLACACALTLSFAPVAGDADPKARLESAMKATELGFVRSASGLSFQVPFTNEGDRGQTVFVSIEPSQVDGLVAHAVYTAVWTHPTQPPDEAVLVKLLTTSKKLGEFYLHRDKAGVWSVRFGATFDATDLPAESERASRLALRLADTIRFVNQVGEETDRMLNGATDLR